MQFITRPLDKWDRPVTVDRRNSPYKMTYDRVLRHLEKELRLLEVSGDVLIKIDVPERKINRNGLPAHDAIALTPRVAIAFKSDKHGPMVYSCDRYHDWKGNVRAIGLGMERLRMVEDTGIVSRGEQYTGFKALPPGIPMPAPMSVEDAARVVARAAANLDIFVDPTDRERANSAGAVAVIGDAEVFKSLYRQACKLHHSDAGGDQRTWIKLQAAAEILKKHHGVA